MGGPSAVKSSTPPETNIVSGTTLRLACGPSAPQQRTVRSLTFEPKPEKHPLWYKPEISRRTVRAPWADCPPFNFEAHTDRHPFWYKFEIQWRTVRPSGPDRPRAHQRLCKLSGTVADCPPLWAGLSASPPEPLQALWNERGLSAPQARTVRRYSVSSQT